MGAEPIVIRFVTFHDVPQMLDAEAYEMIQAFGFDRLHEPLGMSAENRFPRPNSDDFQYVALQDLPTLLGELRVHVHDQEPRWYFLSSKHHRDVAGLLDHPGFVR